MTLNSRSGASTPGTLTRAKAHFSRLIEQAQTSPKSSPGMVSRDWAARTERKGTLAEFLLASPLRDTPMDIERIRDRPENFDL